MEISSLANTQVAVAHSVLQTANKQPELASELIEQSLPTNAETERAQQPVRPVAGSQSAEDSGQTINIRI